MVHACTFIGTFDTQQVLFGTENDVLCFMCFFLANTSSSGCGISVNGIIRANTALRVDGSNHSEWSCLQSVPAISVIGTVVHLFDVNDNGDIAQAPAITVTITSSDELIPLGLLDPELSTGEYITL